MYLGQSDIVVSKGISKFIGKYIKGRMLYGNDSYIFQSFTD